MEPLKLWRADRKKLRPVLVDCPNGRYPASDADGCTVYDNSHFDTEAAAWGNLRDNLLAHIELVGDRIQQIENQLTEARADAGTAARNYAMFQDNYLLAQVAAAKGVTT